MPARVSLTLTEKEQQQLASYRDRHPKPYLRERAAALLQVAQGKSVRQVALTGLFKVRDHETVREWVRAYQDEGLSGLWIKAGRGRKPAFSPSVPDLGGSAGSLTTSRRAHTASR